MDAERLNYLTAMGITPWQLKSSPALDPWEDLRLAVRNCTACALHCSRTQTVFGVGARQASLMLIGEAPGFYEDQKGEPFVGRAGQLLNAMLEAVGFERKDVFIANILKCRPPANRDPQAEEVAACTHFLEQQIALVKPKILLALGRIAAQYLLKTKAALSQLRGKPHIFGEIPLYVTYHPAYLLRTPQDKAKAYLDLQTIAARLQ
jgi:uracil-DNA glycosylase family 4